MERNTVERAIKTEIDVDGRSLIKGHMAEDCTTHSSDTGLEEFYQGVHTRRAHTTQQLDWTGGVLAQSTYQKSAQHTAVIPDWRSFIKECIPEERTTHSSFTRLGEFDQGVHTSRTHNTQQLYWTGGVLSRSTYQKSAQHTAVILDWRSFSKEYIPEERTTHSSFTGLEEFLSKSTYQKSVQHTAVIMDWRSFIKKCIPEERTTHNSFTRLEKFDQGVHTRRTQNR